MFKVLRLSNVLEMGLLVGIDPNSDGLKRAERLGIETTSDGIDGLIRHHLFSEIGVVFDATSASAHIANANALEPFGKLMVDLTPAAIGPYVVPAVNLNHNLTSANVNMVTCGGQATIPIVHAVSEIVDVLYAEIVASIASKSAGPGTRANIDEFTETTSRAIEEVGGAARGKAIIILNPAEPPMVMRDTIQVLTPRLNSELTEKVKQSIEKRVEDVAQYVPGYKLKRQILFADELSDVDLLVPDNLRQSEGYTRVSVFIEVLGAAMYLPEYAGNLDIMTSAALRTAEEILSSQNSEKLK